MAPGAALGVTQAARISENRGKLKHLEHSHQLRVGADDDAMMMTMMGITLTVIVDAAVAKLLLMMPVTMTITNADEYAAAAADDDDDDDGVDGLVLERLESDGSGSAPKSLSDQADEDACGNADDAGDDGRRHQEMDE